MAYDDFAWGETCFYGVMCLETTYIPLNSGYRNYPETYQPYTSKDNTNSGTTALQENHQVDSEGHAFFFLKKKALPDFH